MTDSLAAWIVIAKSPVPLNRNQIRARARLSYAPQTLGHLLRQGMIERSNVDGVAVYTAVCAPSRLPLAAIDEIARVRSGAGA